MKPPLIDTAVHISTPRHGPRQQAAQAFIPPSRPRSRPG